MAAPTSRPNPPPRTSRRALAWAASLVGAAVLVGLAGRLMPLVPERVRVVSPKDAVLAGACFAVYLGVRAHRMAVLLDPVARAEGRRRFPRRILWGSGLVSFLVLLVLPLRLGELSRPLVIDRSGVGSIRATEVLAATAAERVADGIALCAMLAAGLATVGAAGPDAATLLRSGATFLAVFAAAAAALVGVARRPGTVASAVARLAGGGAFAERTASLVHRVAATLRPAGSPGRLAALAGWTLLYWGLAVAYPWALAHAVGLPLSPGEAALVVAAVGLAIQLPGGPAQVGSFQFGAALALAATGARGMGEPAVGFVAALYALQVVGTAVGAGVGLSVLAWGRGAEAARRAA